MRHGFSFVLALSAAMVFAAGAGADNWLTYHNDRYGTTIDYPDIFKPQPPPDSNDGRTFKNAAGADFWVAASYNALDFDVARYRDFVVKNLDPAAAVTYQARGDIWFVISGTNGANIFYERHLLSYGAQLTESFAISYPASLKQTYDPIAARMAKSFRSGTGFQSPSGKP
jgi:hypothetical protein